MKENNLEVHIGERRWPTTMTRDVASDDICGATCAGATGGPTYLYC